MPPDSFLHERSDFKALVDTVANNEKINDPAMKCRLLGMHAKTPLNIRTVCRAHTDREKDVATGDGV